jgi:hypothetical protein
MLLDASLRDRARDRVREVLVAEDAPSPATELRRWGKERVGPFLKRLGVLDVRPDADPDDRVPDLLDE